MRLVLLSVGARHAAGADVFGEVACRTDCLGPPISMGTARRLRRGAIAIGLLCCQKSTADFLGIGFLLAARFSAALSSIGLRRRVHMTHARFEVQ